MSFAKLRIWILVSLLLLLSVSLTAYAQVTVILTRHAEKASTPPKDPPLTEAGKKRADQLASMLADSGVEAIYVTELLRTQQTAAPLAERVQVKPTTIPAADTDTLVKAIRARQNGVVVVVGHSNTVPGIIAALGGPKLQIADFEYNNLFVLTVGDSQSSLLRVHYGDASAVPIPNGSMRDMQGPAPKN